MMRLSRRRAPSAQAASCPAAARSNSGPKRAAIAASRRCRSGDLPPNQKRTRWLSAAADNRCRPNQKSRTLRASSMLLRLRARAVRLEQPLELLGGLARGGEELRLVLLDLVLRGQRLLVVLAEAAHRLAC